MFHTGEFPLCAVCYCTCETFRGQGPFRDIILLQDGVSSAQHNMIMKTVKKITGGENAIHAFIDMTQAPVKFKCFPCYFATVLWVHVAIASLQIC